MAQRGRAVITMWIMDVGGWDLFKAVLFDMDGVLVDTEPEYQKLDIMLAGEMGIALVPEEQSRYVGVSTVEMWRDMQKRYGFEQDPLILSQREEAMIAEHYRNGQLSVYDDAVALLKDCAKSALWWRWPRHRRWRTPNAS